MAQYLLSVWHDTEYELDFETDDARRQVDQVTTFNEELVAAEALVFAAGLHPSAYVVRTWNDEVTEIDGPYADTKELMGGFWVIEAAEDGSAKDWARRAAAACEQPVEVRKVQG